jgi:hypothetical protein
MSIEALKSFKGAAKLLDALDIPKLADRILVSEDHLGAFLDVEARARGFDSQGRPIMLYEPHVFYRNLTNPKTRQVAVHAGLAYPRWGMKPYPRDSYSRLEAAMLIDETAALKACSIGMSQVLVENHVSVGFKTPQDMWRAFMADEEEHVETMIRFILVNGIDDDLRAERWAVVARVYNGPGYAKNKYDVNMAAAFAKRRRLPDQAYATAPVLAHLTIGDVATVKSVQGRLHELGYPEVGKIDGMWGTKLRAGVLGFRADHSLPLVADIDEGLLAALMLAQTRPVSNTRATTTVAEVRAAGSRQIAAADKSEGVGWITAVGGAATAAGAALKDGGLPDLGIVSTLIAQINPLVDSLKGMAPLGLALLGAYIVWQQWKIKRARVDDTREGKHVGR